MTGNLARPACSRCIANGDVCQYAHKKRRPGPPKGFTSSKSANLTRKPSSCMLRLGFSRHPRTDGSGVGQHYSPGRQSSQVQVSVRNQSPRSISRRHGLSTPLPPWPEEFQLEQNEGPVASSEPTLAFPYVESAFRNPTIWDEPYGLGDNASFRVEHPAATEQPLPSLTSDPAFQVHL